MQQHTTIEYFYGSSSWIILSDIESSIKHKIETAGKPLSQWNINIYRGVLTGCNEAFIISTEQREAIIKNCQTEEEAQRTSEIIRPLLRGRDIKRYGYEWAGLWVINTHNGVKGRFPRIEINDYPAIKSHLDLYWDVIKDRADQGDTPYNLRNCAYLDEFNKPKAMWKIIGCNINFAFDDNKMVCNNAVDIITGDRNILLQFVGIMNSKLFDWYLKLTTEAEVQGGGIQLYVTTLEKTLVKLDFSNGLGECVENRVVGKATDEDVDKCVFEAYGLTENEISYILNCKAVNRQ